MHASRQLKTGLSAAYQNLACGRDDIRLAMHRFADRSDAGGELVAASALVLFIGIADDDYRGFQDALERVARHAGVLGTVVDPEHRLIARAASLFVPGFTRPPQAPSLAAADAVAAAIADAALSAAPRCCAALAVLACFDASFDLERTLWLELQMRPVLGDPALSACLAAEWRHAMAQALYQCDAPQQAEALRARLDAPDAPRWPAIELKRALVEAQAALGDGRIEAGRNALLRAEPLLDPRAPRQAGWWHLLRSRLELLLGHPQRALTHAGLSLRLASDCDVPERWMGVTIMQPGQIHMAAGAWSSALPFFERAGCAAQGTQADFCWCLAHFARALDRLAEGAPETGRDELRHGLALARRLNWTHFLRASPRAAAEVCAAALEHDIETGFVREVIAARALDAVRPDLAAWPWPIRVCALGRSRIDIDGVALVFRGKVARKPLELLHFLVAAGGGDVSVDTLSFALWPQLDGDNARAAFHAALHRLRRLLRHDDALVLELGRLSLNPKRVWVDCLAFEQLVDGAGAASGCEPSEPEAAALRRAIGLYSGHFLNDTEDAAWQATYRARLAGKFKRAVGRLARQRGTGVAATGVRGLLERALEIDPMAEDLARELMQLLFDAGEQAAALAAFERCRAAIDRGLAARPSAATMQLLERIRGMG